MADPLEYDETSKPDAELFRLGHPAPPLTIAQAAAILEDCDAITTAIMRAASDEFARTNAECRRIQALLEAGYPTNPDTET